MLCGLGIADVVVLLPFRPPILEPDLDLQQKKKRLPVSDVICSHEVGIGDRNLDILHIIIYEVL